MNVRRTIYPLTIGMILAVAPAFGQSDAPNDQQEAQSQPAPAQTPPAAQSPDQILRPPETKDVRSTGRKILRNFWHDQKAIWTSPAHINSKNVRWWGVFGASTAILIATDRRTSSVVSKNESGIAWSKGISHIGAAYVTVPVATGLYVFGRHKNDPKAREAGILGLEALLDSQIAVAVMKAAAGRERPDFGDGHGHFFKGQRGFPSGHAIMTWSFASLISHEYAPGKITPVIAYSLASLVSVSRFTARKHFASDIVAGSAMGWFIGRYVYEHHLDPEIHKRYNPILRSRYIPEVVPILAPQSRIYGLSLTWTP